MPHQYPPLFENIPEETLRWEKNYFTMENIQFMAEGGFLNRFAIG